MIFFRRPSAAADKKVESYRCKFHGFSRHDTLIKVLQHPVVYIFILLIQETNLPGIFGGCRLNQVMSGGKENACFAYRGTSDYRYA